MKAAVYESVGVLASADVEEPRVEGAKDVKVAVLACGICGTDLHILTDPPTHPATQGVVLGHEFVGEVVEVGPAVESVKPGQRVAIRPIVTCGACKYCLDGVPNHCTRMEVHGVFKNGGLAEYVVVPDTACIAISSHIPLEVAALTEPLACVLSAVEKAALRPGEDVVVLGAGAIGLMFIAAFKAAGAGRIAVVELSPERSEIARQLGADVVIDPRTTSVEDEVAKLLPYGPDVVVDAVGSQLATSVTLAGRLARVVLFGMNTAARAEVAQHLITEKELQILGNFVGQIHFADAIRFLEAGIADLSPIISHTYKLDDLPESLDEIRSGSVTKAVVLVNQRQPLQ